MMNMICYVHYCQSQVKEKMLYAATKATIRKAFSSGVIVDDVAATHKVREERTDTLVYELRECCWLLG